MQKHMRKTGGDETNGQPVGPDPESQHTAKEIDRKLDALLDEIDDVLEQNAEEFVAGYVQHGGE